MKVELIASTPDALHVAFAAIRTCYSSSDFDQIWGEEYSKYESNNNDHIRLVKQIVGHGHCHDDETQILTQRGYVYFKDLLDSDQVAQFDQNTNFLGFTNDYTLVSSYGDYDMYTTESQTVNFKVSDGHKFIFATRNAKNLRVEDIQHLNERKEFKVPNVANKSSNITNQFTENELKLFGFFIGDGTKAVDNNKLLFHLQKERKIEYLKSLGFDSLHINQKPDGTFYCSIDSKILPTKFYDNNGNKIIPVELFSENIEFLLDGLMNSDGHISNTNTYMYDTSSEPLSKQLALLFTIHGINFRISDAASYKENGVYRFTLVKSLPFTFVKDARHKEERLIKTSERCNIYGVETPSRFVATMRKGIPLISGNTSTLEHISFTFSIAGISRACLAQVTRHRIASYSVRSQRYTKLDDVVPTKVDDNTHYQHALEVVHQAYQSMLRDGVKAEDARMILPQSASTNLVMTINLRSFMNMYSVRKPGTHAQAEIQELVDYMKDLIVAAEPWTEELF